MTRKTLFAIHAFGGMTANERRLGRFLRDGSGHPAPVATPAEGGANEDDPFAAAFAEHSAEGEAGAEGGAGADVGAGAPTEGGAEGAAPEAGAAAEGDGASGGEGAGEGGAGESAEGAGAAPAAAPGAVTPPANDKPGLDAEEVLNRLAGMIQQPAAPAAAPQPQGDDAPQAQPIYNDEELALLTEYEKNWPDVAKAETLKRRAEYADIFKFVFSEVANYVKPLFDQTKAIGNTLHMGELKQAVPDYSENLEQEVNSWIDTQPSYLQPAYKHVMQNGTSDEVADLIGRYRAATGAAPAPAAPAAPAATAPAAPKAAPAAAPKTELSSAAKQAADALAPVSGERSQAPQTQPDVGDFDSAFSRYAATMDD